MLVDDWGLTRDNGEGAECAVSSAQTGGCANKGYFQAGATVYDSHRTGAGTRSSADSDLVEQVLKDLPANLKTMKEYQMSFRGEESSFTENVAVSEGKADWETTPFEGGWKSSYGSRSEDFLGK